MTTLAPALPARPAHLDARDAAILRSVWRRWAGGQASTYTNIDRDTGFERVSLSNHSVNGATVYRVSRLLAEGWLRKESSTRGRSRSTMRTIRPGPLFGGLGSDGVPYFVIEDGP